MPTTHRVLRCVWLSLVVVLATRAEAGFFNCPQEVDPELGTGLVCRVENPSNAIEIFASDDDGGLLALRSWTVDGVEQIDRQQFLLYDATVGEFPDLDLTTASRDEGRDQIIIVFEDPSGTYGANVTWTFQGPETLNTAITLFSTSSTHSQTAFVYSDFAINDTDDDDLIDASSQGSFISYVDGPSSVSSVALVPAFPAPTSFDTGTAADFAGLLNDQLVPLDGTQVATGPADLVSVQAWDYVHEPPFAFRIEFNQSITVPEPEGLGTAALLAIALLTHRSRRNGTRLQAAE